MQVLARANRERLRVLLSEAEQGRLGDNERYAAALRCSLRSEIHKAVPMEACKVAHWGEHSKHFLSLLLQGRCGVVYCVGIPVFMTP